MYSVPITLVKRISVYRGYTTSPLYTPVRNKAVNYNYVYNKYTDIYRCNNKYDITRNNEQEIVNFELICALGQGVSHQPLLNNGGWFSYSQGWKKNPENPQQIKLMFECKFLSYLQ